MSDWHTESSARVSANRRKTLVVLAAFVVVLAAASGWAYIAGRDRARPPAVAAAEFIQAIEAGDCDLAARLTVPDVREDSGAVGQFVRCEDPSGRRVSRARVVDEHENSAVVVVELADDSEQYAVVGVTYESATGRWLVSRPSVQCADPLAWRPPAECRRWAA